MDSSADLAICVACGTQFDVPLSSPPKSCRICDDPRQFVPPTGQSWTSLHTLRSSKETHTNKIHPDSTNASVHSISTSPKVGIGQRCILLETPHGNVLWDCITYLDDATVDFIRSKGGLKAIVISHPHYYSTHLVWAEVFGCSVYLAAEDEEWLCREDVGGRRRFLGEESVREEIVPGVVAVKVGGHFPGSLVLGWEGRLFIADSFVTAPSAYYHIDRPPGTTSYAFMWSIPNMIPLPPSELLKMWKALEGVEFESTYGAFVSTEVRDKGLKGRVLESMKIQTRAMGHEKHEILEQSWP
ncbi:beta-lactamase-like protein [Neohortaea acidophila]|uniref:Beta-lactamase-like protein n=1 Tax=Neohortaea acidophila TaxID=245834 RepID=A0A6A6PRP3_9PEZI|nr:beta-lactamase-like protein [Neohortaea acidophila]KAF2482324.1 beta-lactamase-like protein [Neohortaea acidophila]